MQDILTHEALYKVAKLLDQFCDGMKKVGPVLEVIRSFPELFVSLFTHTGIVDAVDVVNALKINSEMLTSGESLVVEFLKRYIRGCDQKGSYRAIQSCKSAT